MVYGIAVRTQLGLSQLGDLRTAQEIARFTATTQNGNIPTPAGINPSNGGVLVNVLDGREPPQVRMRADGQTVWETFAAAEQRSSQFEIIWIRYA